MSNEEETPAKTPVLRVPAHGGGLLFSGGVPGNRGGGRPKNDFGVWASSLRDTADRAAVEHALECGSVRDRLRAVQLLDSWSVDTAGMVSAEVATGVVKALFDIVRRHLADRQALQRIEHDTRVMLEEAQVLAAKYE